MQTAERHEWLSVRETARKYRLSEPTIYRLVAAGALRALQPGGPGSAIRIDASELEARVRPRETSS
jgi:excisionase family DNA binding protein